MNEKILVIGAGASEIMASLTAKNENNSVTLIEKNKVVGQKLSITGSSRCNITNIDDRESFFKNIMENAKFFYGCFSKFSNYDFITYLEELGIELVYEGIRAYPKHQSAQRLVNSFIKKLDEKNIKVNLQEEMIDISIENGYVKSVLTNKKLYLLDEDFTDVILCTGGLSYNTNNTFCVLKNKIKLTRFYPSLTNVETVRDYGELSGVAIQNAKVSCNIDKKLYSVVGDILFTQKGLSGPAILDITSHIVKYQDNYVDISKYEKRKNEDIIKYKNQNIYLEIDFLNDISYDELENILFDNSKKLLKTKLSSYLPNKLAKFLLEKCDKVDIFNMKKEEKRKIVSMLKEYKLQIKKYGDIKSAIVTKGGIDVSEINPKNMRCKNIENLYFAGECIDIDALEGGYNLQIAFSTGYVAGANFNPR